MTATNIKGPVKQVEQGDWGSFARKMSGHRPTSSAVREDDCSHLHTETLSSPRHLETLDVYQHSHKSWHEPLHSHAFVCRCRIGSENESIAAAICPQLITLVKVLIAVIILLKCPKVLRDDNLRYWEEGR